MPNRHRVKSVSVSARISGSVTDRLVLVNARRRDRGSLVEARKVGLWFEADADARLTDLADAAGTTRSALAQWLIERADVDPSGVPAGWHEDHPRDEELPIDTR